MAMPTTRVSGARRAKQRQLDLDAVLALMGGGVEFQAGDGAGQLPGEVEVRCELAAGERPRLVRGDGPVHAERRVLGARGRSPCAECAGA